MVALSLASRTVFARPEFGGDCTACHGPRLSSTPANGGELDFGPTLVGQSSERELSITNTGGNSGGRAKRLSGNFPETKGEFILDGASRFTDLARNTTTSRTYQYAPNSRGSDSESMAATADNSDNLPVSGSTVTFTGQGAAPVISVDTQAAEVGDVRIGTSAAARITIQNTGDGNLSGIGAASNLNGTAEVSTGDYSGLGGNFSLGDGVSQSFDYLFAPSSHGQQSAVVPISSDNGAPDGTNAPHAVEVTLTGNGVGPVFSSDLPPGSILDFGSAAMQTLTISNLTPDPDLGDLTDLTLLSAMISGPDAALFSIDGFSPGTVLSKADTLNLGLGLDSQGGGQRNAVLTLTTDQGGPFGEAAASFQYSLTGGSAVLLAGDANMDYQFNQLDLVQVQIAAKYLTGQAATWGDGDWNGAPGGTAGAPPAGDGQFNQLDIIAALGANTYLKGPYAAIQSGGQPSDGQTSIVYHALTGELAVDAPSGTNLTSISIDSAASIFTGDSARNVGGNFDNASDGNIFKATFGGSFGDLSFGNVAPAGLSEDFLVQDLTVVGTLQGGRGLGAVDLIYVPVPEPSCLMLLALGIGLSLLYGRF